MKKIIALAGLLIMGTMTISACGAKTSTLAEDTMAEAAAITMETNAVPAVEPETAETPGVNEEDMIAFAERIQEAVSDQDMEAFSDLLSFPTYLKAAEGTSIEIKSKEDFMTLDLAAVFGNRLATVIANVDTVTLTMADASVVMGETDINITFNISEDGEFGITEINE